MIFVIQYWRVCGARLLCGKQKTQTIYACKKIYICTSLLNHIQVTDWSLSYVCSFYIQLCTSFDPIHREII